MSTFVIAGGSSGIGLGLVAQLSQAGHQVIVVSRTADSLQGLPGVAHLPVDLTSDEVLPESLPDKIDGLAYCPGSLNLRSFRSLKPGIFRDDFEINVIGAVKVLQAALPGLKASEQSTSSVLMFSTVAVGRGMSMHASVAAAKGAVEGLVRSLASEWAPKIRVNGIAPALTDTPLASRFFGDEEKARAMGDKYPLKRTGSVEDLAAMGLFLLQPTSDWVTGQVIGVDGGMSTLM
jgi:3-oxoacyl-[acyl-carrier protein] reductase